MGAEGLIAKAAIADNDRRFSGQIVECINSEAPLYL